MLHKPWRFSKTNDTFPFTFRERYDTITELAVTRKYPPFAQLREKADRHFH